MMDIAAARRGDENVSTPAEMVRLLEAIHQGKLLDKELTAELIRQLSTTKASYIPRELPPNVQVADKPGDLDGVRNDCGLVFVKNRPFAISVMTAWTATSAQRSARSGRSRRKRIATSRCAAKPRRTAASWISQRA